MRQTRTALVELQRLDQKIAALKSEVGAFDPKIAEIEEPALQLESEVEAMQKRLTEIKLEQRRVEGAVQDKQERMKKLDERLGEVRTVREEAAVQAEQDMVRRALENEETEMLTLLDQVRRIEERLAEQESALQDAQALVEPAMEELLAVRGEVEEKLAKLKKERDAFAEDIDSDQRHLYERIMAGSGRRIAVAALTQDGACGNCYSVIPLQLQSEVLHSEVMIRCEGCGVILTPPSEEGDIEAEGSGEPAEAPEEEGADEESADDGSGDDESVAEPEAGDGLLAAIGATADEAPSQDDSADDGDDDDDIFADIGAAADAAAEGSGEEDDETGEEDDEAQEEDDEPEHVTPIPVADLDTGSSEDEPVTVPDDGEEE